MSHDEIQELLGAYALDAVDADERAVVEAHLLTCARCRAEIADHREVAALLAHSGSDAPDGVWTRIVGSLEEAPPPMDLAPVVPMARARRRLSTVAVSLSAAAAVLIAFLGFQVRDQGQRIDELQTALRHDPLGASYDAAMDRADSRPFELTSADGQTVVRGIVTRDGDGYLRLTSLPDLPGDRTYQLWGAAGDEMVSLGVVGDRPTIIPFHAGRYAALAITEEDAPGVIQSEKDPVVIGEVS